MIDVLPILACLNPRRFIQGGNPVSSSWVAAKLGQFEVRYGTCKVKVEEGFQDLQMKVCKSAMLHAGSRLWWQPRDFQVWSSEPSMCSEICFNMSS